MTLDSMSSAVISPDGRYRYQLRRRVGPSARPCAFVMLNPSTADATEDDPTIRRCMAFAARWGCGELIVVNLFAVRATKPAEMLKADDPVGPDNMEHIKKVADYVARGILAEDRRGPFRHLAGPVVCAWGNHGPYMGQDETVLGWLEAEGVTPMALKVTKAGEPCHPLYLPATLEPRALAELRVGQRPTWGGPETAPEHEKSGSA